MRDNRLQRRLDTWGAEERLTSNPLPSAIGSRLSTVRTVRRATAGGGIVIGVALAALAIWSLWPPDAPPPAPVPPAISPEPTETVEPTIRTIYSMNEGLAGTSDEISLPETPSLDWASEPPLDR